MDMEYKPTMSFETSIPLFSFAGFSNSGKTTLVCKVVAHLKTLGIRVATVKHDGHNFSLDQQNKDTWKHRQAGAEIVAIASHEQLAVMDYRAYDEQNQLNRILEYIDGVDLILVEGFKSLPIPKIFVLRDRQHIPYIDTLPMIEGIAADFLLEQVSLRVYDINDVASICRHIIDKFNLETSTFRQEDTDG